MRTSFLLVIVGTFLSFVTGTSIGRIDIDAVGVGVVLLGCAGVLGSLIAAAFADDRTPTVEPLRVYD